MADVRDMDVFADFVSRIGQPQHQARMVELFAWILDRFPNLAPEIKWNQPMFTDHGTYIIGFSVAKPHMAVAPEKVGISQFSDEIEKSGYSRTDLLFRIRWNQPVDFDLLEKIIEFNLLDKADCTTFWRS